MEESSDALDSAALSAGFFKRINGGRMDTGDMAAMGLNSIMGISNAQNSLMGSGAISNGTISNAQQQAAWNAATLTKVARPEVRPDRVELITKIVQAENGFIVSVCNSYGDILYPHIASTIEDVTTIITSQLASRMLDKAE